MDKNHPRHFTLKRAKYLDNFEEKAMCLGIGSMFILFCIRSTILQVFDIPAVLFLTWGGMAYLSRIVSKFNKLSPRNTTCFT